MRRVRLLVPVLVSLALFGCDSGSGSNGPSPRTKGAQWTVSVNAWACSTVTKHCINLPVPEATVSVATASGVVTGVTDDSGTATLTFTAPPGPVEATITSDALLGGKQTRAVNLTDDAVSTRLQLPMVGDLVPGTGG